jgi:hypothetical protein
VREHAAARQTCGEKNDRADLQGEIQACITCCIEFRWMSTEIQTEFAAAIPVSDESDDSRASQNPNPEQPPNASDSQH